MSVILRRIAAVERLAQLKLGGNIAIIEQRGNVYIYKDKDYTENMLRKQLNHEGVEIAIIDDL